MRAGSAGGPSCRWYSFAGLNLPLRALGLEAVAQLVYLPLLLEHDLD
jgi:hypothetical protein